MEKRIKTFSDNNSFDIERQVNNFLESTRGKLHDLYYDVSFDYRRDSFEHTVMLIFTPWEE